MSAGLILTRRLNPRAQGREAVLIIRACIVLSEAHPNPSRHLVLSQTL